MAYSKKPLSNVWPRLRTGSEIKKITKMNRPRTRKRSVYLLWKGFLRYSLNRWKETMNNPMDMRSTRKEKIFITVQFV
jgi:hypothetical protein